VILPLFLAVVAPACSLFPGWKQEGPARSYEGESLFEYMDGNSEGYYAYGFVRMSGVTCVRGEDKIIVDISEMADPEMAYGMFTANRDATVASVPIGSGGQIVPRKLIFTKDKYYVEIAAEPEKDHTATLAQLAKVIDPFIPGSAYKPEAVNWFPPAQSVRLVPQSVLGIGLLKRGYVAQYADGRAFAVTDSSADSSRAVFGKLRARFPEAQTVALGDEGFEVNDKYLGHLVAFRKGARIGGAAGNQSTLLAKETLKRLP
jgi:hypothetical protein